MVRSTPSVPVLDLLYVAHCSGVDADRPGAVQTSVQQSLPEERVSAADREGRACSISLVYQRRSIS